MRLGQLDPSGAALPAERGGSSPGNESRGIGYYAWYVACALAVAHLIAGVDRYLIAVLLEPVKADLRLTDSELGLLSGISFALMWCLGSIPMGRIADVTSRKLIIVAGLLVWSLATLACAFAHSFAELFAARLVVGLGEATLLPAGTSLIVAYSRPENLTKSLAIFSMGSSLGRATAFLGGGSLLGLLIATGGMKLPALGYFKPWQGVMFVAALLGIAIAGLLFLTLREPARRETSAGKGSLAESIQYFWAHKNTYLYLFIVSGLVIASATALATWMTSLYVRTYGLSVSLGSAIIGVTSVVVGPTANMASGFLTDRLVARNVKAVGLLLGAAALALGPLVGLSFWLLHGVGYAAVTYALFYFALVMAGPAIISSLQLIIPDRHRGFITSLYFCAYSLLGLGLGPLVVGLLNDFVFRSETAINLSLALSFTIFAAIGVPYALSAVQLISACSPIFTRKDDYSRRSSGRKDRDAAA